MIMLAFGIGFVAAVVAMTGIGRHARGHAGTLVHEQTVAPLGELMERDGEIHDRVKDHCVMGYVDVNGNIVLPKWKEMP